MDNEAAQSVERLRTPAGDTPIEHGSALLNLRVLIYAQLGVLALLVDAIATRHWYGAVMVVTLLLLIVGVLAFCFRRAIRALKLSDRWVWLAPFGILGGWFLLCIVPDRDTQ